MVDTPGSLTATAGELKESRLDGFRVIVLLPSLSGMFGGRRADSGNLEADTATASKRRRIILKPAPSLGRLGMT